MHARARRFVLAPIGLAGALIGAAACSPDDGGGGAAPGTNAVNQAAPTDEGAPTDGGTITVAVGAELDGINPVPARWSLEGNTVGSAIFDTLLTFDEDRNLVPRLATSVTPNDDATVWTITLRDDVRFHDGTPLDAEAVKANIEARKAVPIAGTALKQVSEVVVTSPTTLEVRMTSPWYGYDYTLAAQGGYMVAPSSLEGPDAARTAVGTGPFRLDDLYQPGQPIVVTRNEDYWGERPHLDGIEFVAIVDPDSRSNALRTGDVDMILTNDAASVVDFRSSDGIEQVEDAAAEETFAMLNLSAPPFDNPNARAALAYGTDRAAVNEINGAGIQVDANQPYTETERYWVAESGYPDYDPAKASEAVAAYESETGQPLQFTISTGIGAQSSEAETLQQQWSAVGIDAEIEVFDQTAFLAKVFAGDFQVAMFRNFAYVNPDSNYIFWHSSYAADGGGINFGKLRSDDVDSALETARKTPDEATREAEYQKLVQAINAELPYIWLYHVDWGLAADEKVGGLPAAQRLGFARQDAKPWWTEIWVDQSQP